MSVKSEIKKQIVDSEMEIEALEARLMRSQISIMGAILNNEEPSETDKEYFRVYSKLIEVERENLKDLHKKLNDLKA